MLPHRNCHKAARLDYVLIYYEGIIVVAACANVEILHKGQDFQGA